MGDKSNIEWTDATWNPIVGCSVVSPGCTNCYAMKWAYARLDRPHNQFPHYRGTTISSKAGGVWTGKVALAPEHIITAPMRWKKPRRIFVNSMGDLFHESVPDEWIDQVFAVMQRASQHTFQVLTKRAGRMKNYVTRLYADADGGNGKRWFDRGFCWPLSAIGKGTSAGIIPFPNVWLGVSTEDQTRADERVPELLATPAAIRFLSCEPLLGPLDLTLDNLVCTECAACSDGRLVEPDTGANACRRCDSTGKSNEWGIDWVICGGESGHGARPMHSDWAREIRDQCAAAGVPFHFKQWGEWSPGSDLHYDGNTVCLDRSGRTVSAPARSNDFPRGSSSADGWEWIRRRGKKDSGRELDGREHNDMPAIG